MKQFYTSEIRTIEPGDGWKLRVALVCPTPYSIGISNLGAQLVYKAFNSLSGVACHRFYSADTALTSRIVHSEPKPKSMETNEPLSRYHVVAFSVNYENDLLNIPRILTAAGIPLLSADRDDSFPMVIAGGVVPTINPEPFAPLVDACVLGESEEVVSEIVHTLTHDWLKTRDKRSGLKALSTIPGLYIPGFYEPEYNQHNCFLKMKQCYDASSFPLVRRFIPNLDAVSGDIIIYSPHSEFPDIHLLEITRGCKRNCKYCLVPKCYGAFRTRSVASIMESLHRIPNGYRLGLLGAGSSEHPDLTQICGTLCRRKMHFSLSSIHVSSVNKEFAGQIHAYGPTTLTLAPETGQFFRRKQLGKPYSDECYAEAIKMLAVPPVKRIKLYFMIGLPNESVEDLDALVKFCLQIQSTIREANRQSKGIPRLSVAVACYVPKAFSVYERMPMDQEKSFKTKINYLASRFRSIREIAANFGSPRQAIIQGILARGDRRVCQWLLQASQPGTDWYSTLCRLHSDMLCTIFEPNDHYDLPWDHLNVPMYSHEHNTI
jgi:radical SAM superfamily enzyme YgiQ (UPF0313 family)